MITLPEPGADLRQTVDACPVAIWSLSLAGVIRIANRAAAEVCGGEGEHRHWRDCWPDEARSSIDHSLEAALRGETATFRTHLVWGSRGRVYAETVVTPILGEGAMAVGFSACTHDITAEWETPSFLNSPSGGAAFWCDLPLPLEDGTAIIQEARASFRPTVLVVDDHQTNRRLVELVLEDYAEVRAAANGLEAVNAFRDHAFDLILMDIQMPVMDGVSAVAEIRRIEAETRRDRTPIVMLSANTDPATIAASQVAGADRHIAKPFTPSLLIGAVTELPADPGRSPPQRAGALT